MDETALVRHVTGLRGTVVKVSAPKQAAIERASLADRRSYISYLACITHDAAVQALLPQVLLGNEHQFTLALLRSVSSQLGPNIQLWRQKSAWNSHQTMLFFFGLMAAWLYVSIVRAVALLSALTKGQTMQRCLHLSDNCTRQVKMQNVTSSLPESAVGRIGDSIADQKKKNQQLGKQSGDCRCGAPAPRVVRARASDGTAESTHD